MHKNRKVTILPPVIWPSAFSQRSYLSYSSSSFSLHGNVSNLPSLSSKKAAGKTIYFSIGISSIFHFKYINCSTYFVLHLFDVDSAVASMWSTVLFPLVPAIFQIAVIEFAAVVSFCLSSLHESGYSSGTVNFLQVSSKYSN